MRVGRHDRAGAATRRGAAATAVLAAVLLVVAACSSGGYSASAKSSSSPSSSPSTSASPSASSSPSASASASSAGSQPADPAAAKAEITKNWEAFFNAKTSTSERLKLLQNGQVLAPAIGVLGKSSRGQAASSTVTSVTFTSSSTARVGYTISLGGRVVLPNGTGESVLDNGTWKVGTKSLCGLLALVASGRAIPGC